MIKAKVGIIRTLPAPDDNAREKFRLQTIALSLPWVPEIESYGDYLRRLNNDSPAALAVMQAAAGLFRGAGYVAFNAIVPANITQAAIAAPYAHVTAPLRRLVDRWGLVICEAVSNKKEIPEWITSTLLEVPDIMRSTHRVSVELESESFSRVEAALLRDRVGEVFPATVLTSTSERATVQLADPVVTASAQIPSTKTTEIKPGTVINVRLESADIPSGKVNFAVI